MMKILFAALLCAGWGLQGTGPASAQSQDYPNKPVRIVVPFPPGGPTDGVARVVADRLGTVLGQAIVIDNRGGAGGSVGARHVAGTDPDGYTLLLTPGGALTSGPAVHKEKLGYDPLKAFVPVAQLIDSPNILCVRQDVSIKTLPELVAYAKANPGKLVWGSPGFGTSPHLTAEQFKLDTGADIIHVPYRGSAPMMTAMLSGDLHIVFDTATASLAQITAGKLRPIAVAGPRRFSKLPDVPTTAEGGLPGLISSFWLGVVAPTGTPRDIIDKLNAALREVLAEPKVREQIGNLGAEVEIGSPEDFGKLLADELKRWSAIVEAAKITVK